MRPPAAGAPWRAARPRVGRAHHLYSGAHGPAPSLACRLRAAPGRPGSRSDARHRGRRGRAGGASGPGDAAPARAADARGGAARPRVRPHRPAHDAAARRRHDGLPARRRLARRRWCWPPRCRSPSSTAGRCAVLVVVMAAPWSRRRSLGYAPVGVGVWAAGAALFVAAAFGSTRDLVLERAHRRRRARRAVRRRARRPRVDGDGGELGGVLVHVDDRRRSCACTAPSRRAPRAGRSCSPPTARRAPARRSPTSASGWRASCTTASGTRSTSSSCTPAARSASLETKPALAQEALGSIETRGASGAGRHRAHARHPARRRARRTSYDAQPGLGRLDDLLARVREAGLPVEVRVVGTPRAAAGEPRPLGLPDRPGGVDQHAQARRQGAQRRDHDLGATTGSRSRSSTTAAGRPRAPSSGGGRGLVGIRERVLLFGGELLVGPRPEGGFGVWARLPYGTMATTSAATPGEGETT